MKRKTLAILGAVAAIAVVGALSIPAIAGGPGGCWGRGPGFGMMGGHGGPGWQGMGGPMGGGMGGGMHGPMGRFAAAQVYMTFDADGNGTVTVAEAEAGIEKLRASHDGDGNGTLSREEFGKLFAEVTKTMADRPFAMLDANGDGQLSAEEMRFPAQMMARMQAWHGQQAAPGAKPGK
ncbi:calcium-binding protein [Xanthobacter autotrophicus]|uniref:EF-hand domain-containing protein n=1 Tax=Xanthobacter TaxID=279 RepID=UPI0024ABD646|nr:EF-hand domain-containing protein [Xanthobacter autotrophicus]MDI4663721.1 calcium-binding protein [Xanthobacter autotrophicus]